MKTIQLIAAGTAAEGNNANVTPGLPAGTSPKDTVLILASIRNSGTGIPNAPAGWKTLFLSGGTALFARIMVRPTDLTMPTISFTGGAANATTIAQAYTIRQSSRSLDTLIHAVAVQSNGSAQNIATPALTVTTPGCLVLHAAWKQNSWTSVAVPAGDTSLAEKTSSLGSTAAQILSGVVQTTATNVSASSFVVTGGVAAISIAVTIALAPYVTTWTSISGGSSPCQFPTDFNAISNAAATAMAAIDSNATYLNDLPAFRISAASNTATVSQQVVYGSVDIDPTDMVDLVSDPYSVNSNRRGLWVNIHYVNTSFVDERNQVISGDSDNNERMTSSRDMNTTSNPPGGGAAMCSCSFGVQLNDTSSVRFSTQVNMGGFSAPANLTIIKGDLSGYWVSD